MYVYESCQTDGPIGTKFCTRLWILMGMDIWLKHYIRPTILHGGILVGFRGSTIQKPGKCGQTAGLSGNKCCTYNAGESGN